MILTELFEASTGSQVMAFADYLEERCPSSKEQKKILAAFGAKLLRKGWVFDAAASAADFILHVPAEYSPERYRIVVPYPHWLTHEYGVIDVSYHHRYGPHHNDSTWVQTKVDISSLPNTAVEELMDMIKERT